MPPPSKPHFGIRQTSRMQSGMSRCHPALFPGRLTPPEGKNDMRVSIQIENIDELRRCNGIDDIELHEEIDRLRVGDHVRLTFLSGANLRKTLTVRITRIRAGRFRGRLAARPTQ